MASVKLPQEEVSMEEIYQRADVFTIHVPLNEETEFMLNDTFFDSFAKPIWFTNTARGKVLDTKALYKAIQNGKVLGAALDVLENEKPNTWSEDFKTLIQQLFDTEKFTITPHVGGWTFESYLKINEVLTHKISNLKIV